MLVSPKAYKIDYEFLSGKDTIVLLLLLLNLSGIATVMDGCGAYLLAHDLFIPSLDL